MKKYIIYIMFVIFISVALAQVINLSLSSRPIDEIPIIKEDDLKTLENNDYGTNYNVTEINGNSRLLSFGKKTILCRRIETFWNDKNETWTEAEKNCIEKRIRMLSDRKEKLNPIEQVSLRK